ncbi:MAG TPA: post-COAP-1 domain-containing protein [Pyrinomonadaceae bacterium]|nr:post-COAP-1 domain-containing protein [Pyrinomonadaceae bacterium]
MNTRRRTRSVVEHAIFTLLLFTAVTTVFIFSRHAEASNPPSGTISPAGPNVVWQGPLTGGAGANETTCVEGTNCDTFKLTLSGTEADWEGKVVNVTINWLNPANDYDLYIHKGENCPATGACDGPIVSQDGNGAPSTQEAGSIDPSSTGTGTYLVRLVFFSVSPGDAFTGTANVGPAPPGRKATYLKDGITFSPNVTVKAPVARRDGEPSNRTDKFGNHYTSAIRGVPAGVDLWYFDLRPGSPTYDPYMRNPVYRGQPDAFTQQTATSLGADGGGDVDLAVGFDSNDPNSPPVLAYSSLVAANVSTGKSTDRGQTFQLNPAGNATGGIPVDDRQWLEFQGKNTVYMTYRTAEPAVAMVQRSDDGGFTYGAATVVGTIGQLGYLDVHQASGTVYVSGSSGQVCVGRPTAPNTAPSSYTCTQAADANENPANLFFVVKVADDGRKWLNPDTGVQEDVGTVYVCYSNGFKVFLRHSIDGGRTWSNRVRVSDGLNTRTALFPWMETGPTRGAVGVVWYGTSSAVNNDDANWQVFYAQSFNADEEVPTFRQTTASDHFIHASNISLGGLLGSANRNLIDYFQVSFDPTGAAVISYADDHNDYDGHTYVTRQIGGPSINNEGASNVPPPIEGANLPTKASPPADGPQVTDFAQDVQVGLLGVLPTNDALDILSVKYSCETTTGGPVLVATMKVSDLLVVPPGANWRMNFAANAPDSRLSPTGDYSFGVSDRGDQFFVRAETPATITTEPFASANQFTFGTVQRLSDGTLAYTTRGVADSGSFDMLNKTITIKVSASKLNPFVVKGPPIGLGTVFTGLRGQTFTTGANAKADITRGGTLFTMERCTGGTVGGGGGGGGNHGPTFRVTGSGKILGKTVSFEINADDLPSGRLRYSDKEQHIDFASDKITGFTRLADNKVTFTGEATINGQKVMFTVEVEDNGEPGTSDRFKIVLTGAVTSTREGVLTQGNIQFHR